MTTTSTSVALRAGLPVALASAITFGFAGPIARSLLDAGWSPAAVVLARVGGAAVLLLIPTIVIALRARRTALTWSPRVLIYGVFAVAGTQLCFFTAIQYAPVSTVLLIEFSAPVLLIFWTWLRTGQAPAPTVLLGAVIALTGLAVVIGVFGAGLDFNPLGTLWAFAAALCLTSYFAISAAETGPKPPALVLTGGGMVVGALTLAVAVAVGVLPFDWTSGMVSLATWSVPFWVPAVILAVVCAAIAYVTGIIALRMLGGRLASFVSLSEVLFAMGATWLLLGEAPTLQKLLGGVIVIAGVVLVGLDGDRAKAAIMGVWIGARRGSRTAGERTDRHTTGQRGGHRAQDRPADSRYASPSARSTAITGSGRDSNR